VGGDGSIAGKIGCTAEKFAQVGSAKPERDLGKRGGLSTRTVTDSTSWSGRIVS